MKRKSLSSQRVTVAASHGIGSLWLAALTALAACSNGTKPGDNGTVSPTCDLVVSEADCDQSQRPIVFVHGTLGSGDQFAHPAMLFGSNGYCQDRIVAAGGPPPFQPLRRANSRGPSPLRRLTTSQPKGVPPCRALR
jgi:hypothetical protein